MIRSMIAGRAHERSSRPLSGPDTDMTDALPAGETALWHAVLQQAFQDATLGLHGVSARRKLRPPSATRHAHARAARDWLLGDSGYFRRVCDLAGLDADAVRASATVAITSADWTLRELESRQAPSRLQEVAGGGRVAMATP